MNTSPPVFETLQAHHDRQDFDCGKPARNHFLQRQARQNADRHVGVTHVAVPVAGAATILAYYTLVTRIVQSALIPQTKLPPGEISVVLLGRLAVSLSAQHQGLGRLCLLRAITQVERAAREIGLYALVLDALDAEARAWYLGLEWGFEELLDDPNHLFLPVGTIRALGLSTLPSSPSAG